MPVMQSPPGAETIIDGRCYLYFAGTGYLGLQGHPEVIHAACHAARRFGIGSATSRGGPGDTPPVLDVERRAAEFFGSEAAFYCMSGYVVGEILARLVGAEVDAVFLDRCSHYSLFDAARALGLTVHSFKHRDANDLADRLRTNLAPRGRPLVMSDGVFAALGTIGPVAEYVNVLSQYPGSVLLIDDAHGLGVLGENGRGTIEHEGPWREKEDGSNLCEAPFGPSRQTGPVPFFPPPRLLMGGTLSKAIGGYGGIVPGTSAEIEAIQAASHYYRGASAPPVPSAAATAKALELVMAQPALRSRLAENARWLKRGLAELGFSTDNTPVPIASLTVGDAANMRRIQSALANRNIMIAYFAAYSGLGPEGALRIAVFATHTQEMIGRLLDELGRVV
jgi:7-keto-8-aminopelargonate synthetase-like enzyme